MGEELDPKRSLRRRFLGARRALPATTAARLSADACARVITLAAYRAARHLVVYAPVGNELDPGAIVAHARDAGKTLYYPRTAEGGLVFLAAAPGDLTPGPHGIPEPIAGVPLPPDETRVLFLVPGVAFDARGARLGRGSGSYDRALALYRGGTRVGLAFELQMSEELPQAAWDVCMHVVVTNARVLESAPGVKETRPWS